MNKTFIHQPSLRPAAWPSCSEQAGMRLVGKDRPLSGTTTE